MPVSPGWLAGWVVKRFTTEDIRQRPSEVAAIVRALRLRPADGGRAAVTEVSFWRHPAVTGGLAAEPAQG